MKNNVIYYAGLLLNWLRSTKKCASKPKGCTFSGTAGSPGEHRRGGHAGLVAIVSTAPHDDAASGGAVHQPVRAGCVHGHLLVAAAPIALRRSRRRPAPAGPAEGGEDGAPERGGTPEQKGNSAGLSHLHLSSVECLLAVAVLPSPIRYRGLLA